VCLLAGDSSACTATGGSKVLRYTTRYHVTVVGSSRQNITVKPSHHLPTHKSVQRACVEHMPQKLMDSFTVDATVHGSAELRKILLPLLERQSAVLLKRLKGINRRVTKDWNMSLEMLTSRKYEIVIFKGLPKKNGAINVGDGSKRACQLACKDDPALRLLETLVSCLLPSGYHLAKVEDVLTGKGSLEAYEFFDEGSDYGQPEHVDASVELGIGQDQTGSKCHMHCGNLELLRKGMPPVALWIPQSSPNYPPVSVCVFAESSGVVLACFTYRLAEYEALLGDFEGNDEEFAPVYMEKLSQHLRETFPHLAAIPLKGRLVTPGPEDALLIHGLCVHCGTGDAGYRLIGVADPPVLYPLFS
jgi:hypothetical protein